MTRSLSFQVLSGFVIVASLLTVLLIANNGYAMNVVCSQIADANRLLLTSNATDLENRFAEINANLFRFISQDPDIQTFSYRQEGICSIPTRRCST
ncbi:hypothetical protein GZH47_23650 [Paenibacillus rhizovicinus]|uniref:Uncharacterized protein n=1 Tax=Paenibacillus rhizovicinus TaxID=2704463 RepID=A0A6C0P5D8_9BACL|nr:hypothetical protein [Paenibacillus rhizovicinus]QHW33496.1 hypothetical protein GZH47_23650 [Paenibacillus rhizovicinus]